MKVECIEHADSTDIALGFFPMEKEISMIPHSEGKLQEYKVYFDSPEEASEFKSRALIFNDETISLFDYVQLSITESEVIPFSFEEFKKLCSLSVDENFDCGGDTIIRIK